MVDPHLHEEGFRVLGVIVVGKSGVVNRLRGQGDKDVAYLIQKSGHLVKRNYNIFLIQ